MEADLPSNLIPAPVPPAQSAPGLLARLGSVNLPVQIRVGRTELTLSELLALEPGDIVTLAADSEQPVEILAGDQLLARGELVTVNGALGVRVISLCEAQSQQETDSDLA